VPGCTPAEGAEIAGEEGGAETDGCGGVDVLEGVVADVEGLLGGDAVGGESVAELFALMKTEVSSMSFPGRAREASC
jgi:hypothetical protein